MGIREAGFAWLILVTTPALAADTFYGRFAANPAACAAHSSSMLAVSPRSLQWFDALCAVRRSYLVGGTWYASVHCKDAVTDVAVQLRTRGAQLMLGWSELPVVLSRCP